VGRILINALILLAFLAIGFTLWIGAGRQISLLLDRVGTVPIQTLPVTPLAYDGSESGGTLQIGELPMSTQDPDYKPFPLRIRTDSQQRLILMSAGKSFLLAKEPGDQISFTMKRSLLSWPTPFEVNFISGHSPSWKRHVYYVLRWRKTSGARLEMIWRDEQYFYPGDGWANGFMTREGSTGLIRVNISLQ
jgi:hypothetical protein